MIIHAIIERQSGETNRTEYGQNVGAMGLDALDQYLHDTDATPISQFMHKDTATLEQALEVAQPAERPAIERRLAALRQRSDWHDPGDGLKTVRTLLERLPHDGKHEAVIDDLETYESILQEASEAGDRFRINISTGE